MSHNQKLMTIQQEHDHSHSCKEEEDDELFPIEVPAIIFDARTLDEPVPPGFNAVKVSLDATVKSNLSWEKERIAAKKYVQQGFRIFWDIHLGLFDRITNQSQFLSLSLALEHFRDTLWKEFYLETAGLCLYRGSADYSLGFLWDDQQLNNLREWLRDIFSDIESFVCETKHHASSFEKINPLELSSVPEGKRLLAVYCREVLGEYLELLSDRLSDRLPCYALLDLDSVSDVLLQVILTSQTQFSKINFGIRGPLFNDNMLVWEGPSGKLGSISREMALKENKWVQVGVCLPSLEYIPSKWKDLENVFLNLKERNIPFRAIPEASLTTDWDGLDYLIVSSKNLTAQSHRKLNGFRAAGGTVIPTESSMNVLG